MCSKGLDTTRVEAHQRGWGPLGAAGGGPLPRPRPRPARRTGALDTDDDVTLQRDKCVTVMSSSDMLWRRSVLHVQ